MSERTVAGEALGQAPNDVGGLGVGCEALGGALVGVHDRCVVATSEALADRREGLARVLAREIHRDLARPGDPCGAALGDELVAGEAEGVGGEVLDRLDGGGGAAGPQRRAGVEVGEDVGGEGRGDGAAGERGEGDDAGGAGVERIIAALGEAVDGALMPEGVDSVSASFAWAVAPYDTTDAVELFRLADSRLLERKRRGRPGLSFVA
jgi:hypothetical protein